MKKFKNRRLSPSNNNIINLIDRASFEAILNYLEVEDLVEFSQLCILFREYSKGRLFGRVKLLPEAVLKGNENNSLIYCNRGQNWTIDEYIHFIQVNKVFFNSLTMSFYHDSLWAKVSNDLQNVKLLSLRNIAVGEQILFDILENLPSLQKLTLESVDLKCSGFTVINPLNLSSNLKYLELNSNSEHFYTGNVIKYFNMQSKLKILKIKNDGGVINDLILPHMNYLEVLELKLTSDQIFCNSLKLPRFEHLRILTLNLPIINTALFQDILTQPSLEKLSFGGEFQGIPMRNQPLQLSSIKFLNVFTSAPIEWWKFIFESCPNVVSLQLQQPKDHRALNIIQSLPFIRHLTITGYFSKILNIRGFFQMSNLSKLEIHSFDSVCLLIEGCLKALQKYPDWKYSIQTDSILFRRAGPLLTPAAFNSASSWFELPASCILQ